MLRYFEALAEIFDFAAGLVQRVPKKTSVAKSDLQNSTARLWKKDAFATNTNRNLCRYTAAPDFYFYKILQIKTHFT